MVCLVFLAENSGCRSGSGGSTGLEQWAPTSMGSTPLSAASLKSGRDNSENYEIFSNSENLRF